MNAKNKTISKRVKHPFTGKRLHRVYVNGKGWYSWNTAYHVYNHTGTYDQLKESDLENIDFNA